MIFFFWSFFVLWGTFWKSWNHRNWKVPHKTKNDQKKKNHRNKKKKKFLKILKSWKWNYPPKNTNFGGSFSFPWFQDFKNCAWDELYKHSLLQIWHRHRKYWTMSLGQSSAKCFYGDARKIAAIIPRGQDRKCFIFHSLNTVFKILKS